MDYTIQDSGVRATQFGCSYWSGHGAYQRELEFFERDLVPDSGQADSLHGELLRCAQRLYYDFFNNGNANARQQRFYSEEEDCWDCSGHGETEFEDADGNVELEECDACGGTGRIETEHEDDADVDKTYDYYIRFIARALPSARDALDRIEEIIKLDLGFTEANEHAYDSLLDCVAHYIITTENRKLLQSDMPDGIWLGRLYGEE